MPNNGNHKSIRIGDIYALRFDGVGSVQSGWRPGVVFQNNIGNIHSPNVVVLPLTSNLKKLDMKTHVLLRAIDTGLRTDSVVLCENPHCIPKDHLGRYITTLSDYYIRQIAEAHLLASAAISFLDPDEIKCIWRRAVDLNMAS